MAAVTDGIRKCNRRNRVLRDVYCKSSSYSSKDFLSYTWDCC